MSLGLLLLIVLVVVLFASAPRWPYSAGWGYQPMGIVGVFLIILVVLLLLGRL
jgi:hypothetical protein